jgi:acyl-CoA thioesterase I
MPSRILRGLSAAFIACGLTPAVAAELPQRACKAPNELVRLTQPLARTAQRLAHSEPLTIVAIGSSSTAGAGASSKAMSYPSRLQAELQAQFPHSFIKVINHGINGEEARDMLARFGDDVIAEKPDLVLWQVGSNSVLRDRPVAPTTPLVLDGVRRLKAIGADVVIIDPQFAPKLIAKSDARAMVDLISETAKAADVDLVQRFSIMRYWHDDEHMAFSDFLSPDDLHMNDWSYGCLAKLISASITEAATRGVTSAQAVPRDRFR